MSLPVPGQAQVIADDPVVIYRSQHLPVPPLILQVPAYVELRPIVNRNVVRRVLFCRDNWRCAYCGRDGGPERPHGRPCQAALARRSCTAWDNVVFGLPPLQPPQGRPAALRGRNVPAAGT